VRVRRRLSRYKDIAYRVMNALHIPVSIIHWSPLYWVFYILHRPKLSIDLEQDDKTFDFPVAGKHVLIVDDVLLTGNSVAYVRNRLLRNGAASVAVAVLHYVGEVVPDYYLSQTDGLWWFPWSYNSPYRHEYMGWLTANGLAR
jgi:hypothetical protein